MDTCILIPPYRLRQQKSAANRIVCFPAKGYIGTYCGLVGRSVLCPSTNQVTN